VDGVLQEGLIMPGDLQSFVSNFSQVREAAVNEAFAAAQQVQQRAEAFQAQTEAAGSRPPAGATSNLPSETQHTGVVVLAIGALAAVGVAYLILRKE
jgi:hypothetical protein